MSDILLGCPFCGNTPRLIEPHESSASLRGESENEEWLSFVECECVDMFFVKGSGTSQVEARSMVTSAWNRRPSKTTAAQEATCHVNSGAYRRISLDEWRSLGGDDNKFCDWHEGIGYVVYDAQALEQYRAKIEALQLPTAQTTEGKADE